MKDNSRARFRRRVRPPIVRMTAAIVAVTALTLIGAACSGNPSGPAASGGSGNGGGSSSSPSTNAGRALAFASCVRSHGVPNYPDPSSGGNVAKESAQQLGVSNSQLQTALSSCQHFLPNTGNVDDNPAALHQWWNQMRRFSQCMHAHGVPNWPDPSPYPQDPLRPTFNLHAAGIGFHLGAQPGNIVNSPQIQAQVQRCESVVHQNVSGWYD